jgi:hypothetical protein
MLDSAGARHLRERNHLNSLHIFTFGDMSNPMWYLVLTLYMSSQSWFSCGFFGLLWLVEVPVLSNLVCAGPFHPKPTQDHKVSICIKIMSMRSSCLCTYCLQEGLMSMKVFSLIFCALMHMAKIHVTHCLLYHGCVLTRFYIPYSHVCIHVGGAYACYMFFQSFAYYSLYLYLKLWCMLPSITKKGDIESTSDP